MPTLYILCGLPFAGKTALANALARRLNLTVVSLDHVKQDEGFFTSDHDVPDAEWPGIYDVVHASLLMPLRLGSSVVYDADNLKRHQRDELRELARSRGFETRLIYVAAPEATLRQRAGDASRTVDRALAVFEEPSQDEGALTYAPTQDVERWIKTNFSADR